MTRLVRLAELAENSDLKERLREGAISIGNFDGVHLGHQELLRKVRSFADEVDGPAIAVVMDPHPASVLRPHGAPPALTTLPRRAELMSRVGIDFLLVCEATREFLNQTAEEFFKSLLVETLHAKAIVEGPNFFFGRDRTGNVARLSELCSEHSIELTIVEPSVREDRMVSSSRVREAIADGEIELAKEMLGSRYQLTGRVVQGAGRGRTLGFPTANLGDIESMLPGDGVYGGIARLSNGQRQLAAIHIGPNPTFDDARKTKIEVHLLDYDGDLYQQELIVEMIFQVRGVHQFADADSLILQLKQDLLSIRDRINLPDAT
jgi:riboflavin kinase/FMN adenylyltransferase